MSFVAARARLRAAAFATFGVEAKWKALGAEPGVVCLVKVDGGDDVGTAGLAEATVETTFLHVRAADVPAPQPDDLVQLTDAADIAALGVSLLRILGEPRRARRGDVWVCEAVAVATV